MVGDVRQPGEHIAHVFIGIYAVIAATHDNRIENRTSPSRLVTTNEEPVLFAYGGRTNRIFYKIIVQFDVAVQKTTFKKQPLIHKIVHGVAKWGFGKMGSGGLEPN